MLGSFVVFRQVYLLVNRIAFDNSFLGVSLAIPWAGGVQHPAVHLLSPQRDLPPGEGEGQGG